MTDNINEKRYVFYFSEKGGIDRLIAISRPSGRTFLFIKAPDYWVYAGEPTPILNGSKVTPISKERAALISKLDVMASQISNADFESFVRNGKVVDGILQDKEIADIQSNSIEIKPQN